MAGAAPLTLQVSSLSWGGVVLASQPPAPEIWPASCGHSSKPFNREILTDSNISLRDLANENIRQGGVSTTTFLQPTPCCIPSIAAIRAALVGQRI